VFPHIKPKDTKVWHERWHHLHPETRAWQERVMRGQRENGWVAGILDFRRRYFLGGPNKKNAPPNHTIQSSAAAIMNQAVLRIHEEIPFGRWSRWTGLCLQVHDYAGLYVPESRADEAKEILERCLPHSYEGMAFPPDDVIVSHNWAQQG
jgi:DNA polymerase I-like protein with 3'-5' exonuclease and polymerase domains